MHPEARFGTDPLCRQRLFVNPDYEDEWVNDDEDYSVGEEDYEDTFDEETDEDEDEIRNEYEEDQAAGDARATDALRARLLFLRDRHLYYLERDNVGEPDNLREELRLLEKPDTEAPDSESWLRRAEIRVEIRQREFEVEEERKVRERSRI